MNESTGGAASLYDLRNSVSQQPRTATLHPSLAALAERPDGLAAVKGHVSEGNVLERPICRVQERERCDRQRTDNRHDAVNVRPCPFHSLFLHPLHSRAIHESDISAFGAGCCGS